MDKPADALISLSFYLFNVFFDLLPRRHHLTGAAETTDLKIHTHAQHKELPAAARMLLFHYQLVSDFNIHNESHQIIERSVDPAVQRSRCRIDLLLGAFRFRCRRRRRCGPAVAVFRGAVKAAFAALGAYNNSSCTSAADRA